MKVTNEKTEDRQAFLTIEIEPSEVEESMDGAYKRLVKKARIPGFRKGKAPRAVLENYLGRESVLEEALNSLVPEACQKAIEEQEIEAYAQPRVEINTTDPLVFKAVVPLRPEVKLGDYHSIKLEPEDVEVTEDNVNAVIEQLRHQHATWEPTERPVEFSDLIVMDIESSIDDKPFINQKGAQFQIISDLPFPAPGFVEQLVGMNKEEEKEFSIIFPEDYASAEQAGKEVKFKVKVIEIKQEILPELNDEFAQGISADFQTLDSLREQASSDLKARAEERARTDFEEKVLDAVIDLAEVEFPPILTETEINRTLSQRFQRGNQELEEYLSNVNKTEEQLREELRPIASKRVTQSLVLGRVVEEEKIEVSDSEIDGEIKNIVARSAENKDAVEKTLNTSQARGSIQQTLIARKAMEHLVEIAKGSKETIITDEEVK